MSAEVKWKADRMSSSCQGLSSQLVSEKKSRTCLPCSVCTHSSCSSLRICCPLHYQTRLSLHSSSSQLCPTTLKPTHSLCPPIVELSLFPLWLSHLRLSHFFQPQSTCTSHHTIFCTKFTCPALVPFKISNWLSALNTLKNKIRKPNQTQTN